MRWQDRVMHYSASRGKNDVIFHTTGTYEFFVTHNNLEMSEARGKLI